MPRHFPPRFGAVVPGPDGTPHRDVVFHWPLPPDRVREVMLNLPGVTDPSALDEAILRPVRGGAEISVRLPDDLVAGYGFIESDRIPREAGEDAFGWIGLLQTAVPDPSVAERIPDQLGGLAAVLRMPGSRRHRAEDPALPPRRAFTPTPIDLGSDGVATVLSPGEGTRRLLILFDAENWTQLPLQSDLARHAHGDTAVLLMPSGDPYRRFATLPDRAAVAEWTRRAIDGAVRVGAITATTPDAIIAAGQSYGALAAGWLVVEKIAASAVLQSGSFEQRADTPAGEEDDRPGDLIEALASTSITEARIVVQHGSLEPVAARVAPIFAAAARRAGARVSERAYRGGHDYAWWRTGLCDGLDALAEMRPASGA